MFVVLFSMNDQNHSISSNNFTKQEFILIPDLIGFSVRVIIDRVVFWWKELSVQEGDKGSAL